MRKPLVKFEDLPLFPSDAELADAILGPGKTSEFTTVATLNERNNFPKIDPLWGGRYKWAVKAFFDRQYGLSASPPLAPGGVEKPGAWISKETKKAG